MKSDKGFKNTISCKNQQQIQIRLDIDTQFGLKFDICN